MPALLPPGGSILGDAIDRLTPTFENLPATPAEAANETGRQLDINVLDFEDASRVASSIGLALGITFLVTTASLYAYYYSTTFDFTDAAVRRRRKREAESQGLNDVDSIHRILENLESAFRKWKIPNSEGCQKKAVCEAHSKWFKGKMTKGHMKFSNQIRKIMRRASKMGKDFRDEESEESLRLRGFLESSSTGLRGHSCRQYSSCPLVQ